MHGRALVYCDFKPDNVIQVGDDVKLIDLGGVRHLDDPAGDIYGTVGFQAPEIAEMGPSIAVRHLHDRAHAGRAHPRLPRLPDDLRALAARPGRPPGARREFDSFHRFLLKATAPHPDDRFQSTSELADQLLGVMREVVSLTHRRAPARPEQRVRRRAQPTPACRRCSSTRATRRPASWPTSPPDDARAALEAIAEAVDDQTGERDGRAAAPAGPGAISSSTRPPRPSATSRPSRPHDPWEWRAVWLARRAGAPRRRRRPRRRAAFDRCLSEVPGELAPKLAVAITFEQAGDHARPRLGSTTSCPRSTRPTSAPPPGWPGPGCTTGDVAGALEAYGRVPRTHQAHEAAQVAAARTLIAAYRFTEAADRLDRLALDDRDRAQLDVELLEGGPRGTAFGQGQGRRQRQGERPHPRRTAAFARGSSVAYRRLAQLTPRRPRAVPARRPGQRASAPTRSYERVTEAPPDVDRRPACPACGAALLPGDRLLRGLRPRPRRPVRPVVQARRAPIAAS